MEASNQLQVPAASGHICSEGLQCFSLKYLYVEIHFPPLFDTLFLLFVNFIRNALRYYGNVQRNEDTSFLN